MTDDGGGDDHVAALVERQRKDSVGSAAGGRDRVRPASTFIQATAMNRSPVQAPRSTHVEAIAR